MNLAGPPGMQHLAARALLQGGKCQAYLSETVTLKSDPPEDHKQLEREMGSCVGIPYLPKGIELVRTSSSAQVEDVLSKRNETGTG